MLGNEAADEVLLERGPYAEAAADLNDGIVDLVDGASDSSLMLRKGGEGLVQGSWEAFTSKQCPWKATFSFAELRQRRWPRLFPCFSFSFMRCSAHLCFVG